MSHRRHRKTIRSTGEDSLGAKADFSGGAEADAGRAVRSEQVRRAKKLLRDPDYPSKEILNSVANLLAKHLRPGAEH